MQGTVKSVLILVTCPQDNSTVEPEGVDLRPVDPAIYRTKAQEVRCSVCASHQKEPLPKGVLCTFHI